MIVFHISEAAIKPKSSNLNEIFKWFLKIRNRMKWHKCGKLRIIGTDEGIFRDILGATLKQHERSLNTGEYQLDWMRE